MITAWKRGTAGDRSDVGDARLGSGAAKCGDEALHQRFHISRGDVDVGCAVLRTDGDRPRRCGGSPERQGAARTGRRWRAEGGKQAISWAETSQGASMREVYRPARMPAAMVILRLWMRPIKSCSGG